MHHASSWRNRLHVGLGILVTFGIVALPGTYRRPAERSSVANVPERPDGQGWFGLAGDVELAGVSADGDLWRPAGPLQFHESSDGSARLTGYLIEASQGQAVLQLDLSFGERVGLEFDPTLPGSFREVSGELIGLGTLDGGRLRVETCRERALENMLGKALVCLRTEWIQLPSTEHLTSSVRKSTLRLELGFSGEAIWGTPEVSLELPGFDEPFELLAGGKLIEQSQGAAWMSAIFAQRGHGDRRFQFELNGDSGQVTGMGRSYKFLSGTLRGLDAFHGALIELGGETDRLDVGGSRGEKGTQEVSGELFTRMVREPNAGAWDFAPTGRRAWLRASLSADSRDYVFEATSTGRSSGPRTYALDLGRLGSDFVFQAGGVFTEDNLGGARLTGEVARATNPNSSFYVDLEFSDVDVSGDLQSSWSGLEPWAFAENGGPVERATWRGYQNVRGQLIGLRARAGTHLRIEGGHGPFLIGLGANGRSLTYGGHLAFEFRTEGTSELTEHGRLSIDLRSSCDEAIELTTDQLHLAELGLDLRWTAGGQLRYGADGSLRVTGLLARESIPSQRMLLDLSLEGATNTSGPGGMRFAQVGGRLIGLEGLHGAHVAILPDSQTARLGLNVADAGVGHGLHVPFRLQVISQPDCDVRFEREEARGRLSSNLARTQRQRVTDAVALSSVSAPDGHAFYLPGIANDFIFSDGGHFQEFAGGRALLEGRLVSTSDSQLQFDVHMEFSKADPVSQGETLSRPLQWDTYVEAGGPVDPSSWRLYRQARGILVGVGALSGAAIELQRDDLALQVGLGANGRNIEYGASGDFNMRLLSQPSGTWGSLPEGYVWGELHIELSRSEGSR